MGNILNKPKTKPEVKSRLSVRIASEKDIVEPKSITRPHSAKSFTFDMTSHALPEYPVTYVNTSTAKVASVEPNIESIEPDTESVVEPVEPVRPFPNLVISIEDLINVPHNSPINSPKNSAINSAINSPKNVQYVECYEYKNMKNIIL